MKARKNPAKSLRRFFFSGGQCYIVRVSDKLYIVYEHGSLQKYKYVKSSMGDFYKIVSYVQASQDGITVSRGRLQPCSKSEVSGSVLKAAVVTGDGYVFPIPFVRRRHGS